MGMQRESSPLDWEYSSRNRSSADLHLAIPEEVPSQAQVKGSGNKSVGFGGALHCDAITLCGDGFGVTESGSICIQRMAEKRRDSVAL